jgi:EAL domain-containing protein (putative c-di-GMP-specific phosphodiesterase class I)
MLVIDDEPDICEFIREAASEWGFEAVSATRFAEVELAFRAFKPAMVILDLAMPDHDGVEILHFLARERCEAGIILVSGFDGRVLSATVRLGTGLGLRMLGTLSKPIEIEALEAACRRTLEPRVEVERLELERALQRSELLLHWQPKVRLPSGALYGVEALARWLHPDRGMLMPGDFIPWFERTDLIARLTRYVVSAAMSQQAAWKREGLDLGAAVNLSPRLLQDLDLPDDLATLAREAGVDPADVTLEVTETAAMEEPVRVTEVLSRLRLKGFRVSLDDFGTGHASLLALHRMPFNELKIDKSFVMELGAPGESSASSESTIIVKAVIGLAHHLGLEVCAEGVETRTAWDMLASFGCDVAQGYLISRPVPAAEIRPWVDGWTQRRTDPR